MVSSPLNIYLFLYSMLSFFYNQHRLAGLVGQGQRLRRGIMVVGGILWLVLIIGTYAPSTRHRYVQLSCEDNYPIEHDIWVFPLVVIKRALKSVPWFGFVLFSPFALAFVMWLIGIGLQRAEIWKSGESWLYGFRRIWTFPVALFLILQ